MKKTALTICLLLMAVCCVFGLAACDEKQGETVCRHEYADDYTCHDRTCIHCGEVLPASTPHVFGETVTVAPTCTEAGYTTRTCIQCGYEEVTPQGSALGHDFSVLVETVHEADCMDPGEAVYKCSRCDETETRYSDPLGHTPKGGTVQKVAPTCTDDGYTKYTCDRCGEEVIDPESYVDALGHTHAEGDSGVVTAPTCTEGGYTTYTCTRCGQPYRDDETDALGHAFAVLESEETATCAHAAYEVRECTLCHLVEREIVAPKLSHTYNADGVCTQCNEYVTDVFALSVAKMGDRAAYQYAETDETYGYIVYADPNDGGTQYLLNIDKATIDALIAEGYGRITVRLGNPDQNPRTFNWLPDGATANKGGNNFTTEGFNNSCEFTVAISGPTAANITDEYGLDMYVAFNGIGVTVDCFAVDFTFEKGVPSADDSETLVGFRGSNVAYDAEAGTWTFSDMDLSEQDFVNLWVSELLLDTLSGDHVKFTLTAKSGQAVTFGYTNLDGKTISDNGVFGLLIPNSGDLYVQTIYLAGADADGFVLKIEGVDGHVPGIQTGTTAGDCLHGGYPVYICGCGETVTGEDADSIDLTAHSWGADGVCTVCGEAVNEAFILSGYNRQDDTPVRIEADETYGYIVYADPNDGGTQYRLHIDKAAIDALIAKGYGRITVRLGNPDGYARAFNWLPDGATAAVNVANQGLGFNTTCEFVLPLSGPTAVNITEDGLDMYVAYNGLSGTVDCFAIDFTFEKGIPSAEDPQALVGFRGSNVTYDAATQTYTFTGLDLSKQDFFNIWVSELLLDSLEGSHVKFTFSVLAGEGLTISYGGAVTVAGNQALTFALLRPESGDLFVQTVYMGHIAWAGEAPTGFTLKIEGAADHVYSSTAKTEPTCSAGGYTTYTCACGHSEQRDQVPADPTAHSWGADGNCTLCGQNVATATVLKGYDNASGAALTVNKLANPGDYQVYAMTNENGAIARLNLDKATVDALIAQGYDTLTVTLGGPNGEYRGFAYNVEGDPSYVGAPIPFTVDLASRNTEGGINIRIQYNFGAAEESMSSFIINLAFSASAAA